MHRFPERVVRFDDTQTHVEEAHDWPISFVHINKTAGTTFTQYLRSHFCDQQTVAPPFYGDFAQIGIDNPAVELFWGHFTYAQFIAKRTDAWFISFLRDPIQRVISQYRSLHNPKNLNGGWEEVLPPHARKAMAFAHEANFEEFIFSDDPFILGHIVDLQTLFLSSYRNTNHPEFLSSAIDNIRRKFLFVGITERFEESIDLFRYQLQSPFPYRAAVHQANISQRYPVELTDRTRARLDELTKMDQELYQHACELLDSRVRKLQATIGIGRAPHAA